MQHLTSTSFSTIQTIRKEENCLFSGIQNHQDVNVTPCMEEKYKED